MMQLKNVSKIYTMGENQLFALRNINLTIQSGELLAIVGTSGSGKSTLMHLLGLLDQPSQGHYFIQGEDTKDLNADQRADLRNRSIGFVFQSFFLLPKLSAGENVGLPLWYRGLSDEEIEMRASQWLHRVGLTKHKQHKPQEMSGGQQQRVAIARALVGNPDLVLADEPTGALDSQNSDLIMQLLIDIHREQKTTVVIVTHDREVAARCRRQIILRDGEIVDDKQS